MTYDNQILVTGGTGKLGSVLSAQLAKNNFFFRVLTTKTIEGKLKTFEAKDELQKAFIGGKNLTANRLKDGITWEIFLGQ